MAVNLILSAGILLFAIKMGYLGRILVLFDVNSLELPTDTLSSQAGWQDEVKYQVYVTQKSQINICIFGDSITAMLGNTLGNNTFNFAMGGMTTISQLEQLKFLTAVNVKCNKAIVALGTNDAIYKTRGIQYVRNLRKIVSTIGGQLGAKQVLLIPAFYSTVEASHNVMMAAPVERVEQIKKLTRQVATTEKIPIAEQEIQLLYEGQALKKNLTADGVHLNANGKKIYREALLKIIGSNL